jgi:hypothetical protein
MKSNGDDLELEDLIRVRTSSLVTGGSELMERRSSEKDGTGLGTQHCKTLDCKQALRLLILSIKNLLKELHKAKLEESELQVTTGLVCNSCLIVFHLSFCPSQFSSRTL